MAKSQHVPLRYWFLTLVMGSSLTVVKVLGDWADAKAENNRNAVSVSMLFFRVSKLLKKSAGAFLIVQIFLAEIGLQPFFLGADLQHHDGGYDGKNQQGLPAPKGNQHADII